MDEFAVKLKSLLDNYPDALQDKRRFRNLLSDTFPTESKEVNLLMNGYDVGVVDLRETPEDQIIIRKTQLQKKICKEPRQFGAVLFWESYSVMIKILTA